MTFSRLALSANTQKRLIIGNVRNVDGVTLKEAKRR